jgi:hypothetical protein
MKRMAVIFCLVAFTSLVPATPNLNAQSSATHKPALSGTYVASREHTVQATVEQVVPRGTKGLAPGGHVILATPTGRLDGALGPYALGGEKPLSLVPGQRVTVVGANSTFANQPVFLVRSINTGSSTVNIRTKDGFLIKPSMAKHTLKVAKLGGAA